MPLSVLAPVRTDPVWEPTINGLSIAYGSRPRLRPAYPAAECPCGGTLRLSVGGVLAPRIVTHSGIRTTQASTAGFRRRFAGLATLPYRAASKDATPIASVDDLSPVGLSVQANSTSELLRTLSRVAASKPTSWLSGPAHRLAH